MGAFPTGDVNLKPPLVPADVWDSYQEQLASESPPSDGELEIDIDLNVSIERLETPSRRIAALGLASSDLFAPLSSRHLEMLALTVGQLNIGAGGLLFQEGDLADNLYVVVDGVVEICRRGPGGLATIRRAERGEPVGLLELFYSRERVTLCRAVTDAMLLELPAAALTRVLAEDDAMNARIMRFYEDRLISGFIVALSQVTNLDSTLWARLMAKFKERTLAPDETLLRPGEVSNLLTVVVAGSLNLEQRPTPGTPPKLTSVLPGQYLAINCANSGQPSRVGVFAPEPTTVMEVSHKDLAELFRDFPSLRHVTETLARGNQVDRDVYVGDTQAPTT